MEEEEDDLKAFILTQEEAEETLILWFLISTAAVGDAREPKTPVCTLIAIDVATAPPAASQTQGTFFFFFFLNGKKSEHLREDQRVTFREISDLEAIHELCIRTETEEVFLQEQEEREREREKR
jgi:hypothetical protein